MIITVRPQPLGCLELQPIRDIDRATVRASNKYDYTCMVYLIDSQDVESFVSNLSDENRQEVENGYQIQVEIDDWEFKHMVGGQND